MRRSRSATVILLFAAVLCPGHALGDGPAPTVGSASTPAESALVARAGDYALPTARDRVRAWALNAFGPAAVVGNLAGASWRHWVTEEPPEWGITGRGFAKRFGSGSLTTAISETSLALLSAAMRQDAAYYRSPRPGFGPRLLHALAMTVVARDRDGDKVFSPAKALSPFVGPVVTRRAVYPERYGVEDGLVNGAWGLLINAGLNAANEFIVRSPPWSGGRARVP